MAMTWKVAGDAASPLSFFGPTAKTFLPGALYFELRPQCRFTRASGGASGGGRRPPDQCPPMALNLVLDIGEPAQMGLAPWA